MKAMYDNDLEINEYMHASYCITHADLFLHKSLVCCNIIRIVDAIHLYYTAGKHEYRWYCQIYSTRSFFILV